MDIERLCRYLMVEGREMQAAIFKGEGRLELTDRHAKPEITSSDQVLIRVTGVGICGTDLHILQVPPAHPARTGIVQGHEFTGVIEALGRDLPGFSVGDSVLIDPHPGCGVCDECRRQRPDRCIPLLASSGEPGHPGTIGIFSDGAMAEYVVVPGHSLYKVEQSVPSHIAALAEPLACVINASEKLQVKPGEYVVVLGAGPIGLLFTALLRANGASKLIVSEPSEYRREAAMQVGADIAVHPDKLQQTMAKEMPGGADVAVEAVGPLLPLAIKIVGPRGRVLQFGHDETINPSVPVGELLKKEVAIFGAFIGRYTFDTAARIMASGRLPLDRIVSHQLPLSKVHEGLELLRAGKGLKIVLTPGS
jgi:threonine dehydrogenase-like Zn-dependent dehydrogenase